MPENSPKSFSPYLRIEVDNLADWTQVVLKLQEYERITKVALGEVFGGQKWLFRGQSNATWSIASSLERMNQVAYAHLRDPERYLRAVERLAIEAFKRQAHSQIENGIDSNLEWTMLMRHYGVPTRLVDFTEVPLLSLFFALEDENNDSEDFAVWAVARNAMSDCYAQLGKESKISDGDKSFREHSPRQADEVSIRNSHRRTKKTTDNAYKRILANRQFAERIFSSDIDDDSFDVDKLPALYLYAEKPNTRQRVQHGLFLMATRAASPFMDSLKRSLEVRQAEATPLKIADCSNSSDSLKLLVRNAKLIQFVFKSSLRKQCRDYLHFVGLAPSTVYPDLSGVSVETKKLIAQRLNPTYDATDIFLNRHSEISARNCVSSPSKLSSRSLKTGKGADDNEQWFDVKIDVGKYDSTKTSSVQPRVFWPKKFRDLRIDQREN